MADKTEFNVLDFSNMDTSHLKKPVRLVRCGKLVLPRGADDPTSDHLVKVGGIEIDTRIFETDEK